MATKTFDELKQMAIQIRDEKTNKQNTATRIGTQMLEHLNKLEQDFLDKDTTEGKFSELSKEFNSNIFEVELKNGAHIIQAIPLVAGTKIQYRVMVDDMSIITTSTSYLQTDNTPGAEQYRYLSALSNEYKEVTITEDDVTKGLKYLMLYFNNVTSTEKVKCEINIIPWYNNETYNNLNNKLNNYIKSDIKSFTLLNSDEPSIEIDITQSPFTCTLKKGRFTIFNSQSASAIVDVTNDSDVITDCIGISTLSGSFMLAWDIAAKKTYIVSYSGWNDFVAQAASGYYCLGVGTLNGDNTFTTTGYVKIKRNDKVVVVNVLQNVSVTKNISSNQYELFDISTYPIGSEFRVHIEGNVKTATSYLVNKDNQNENYRSLPIMQNSTDFSYNNNITEEDVNANRNSLKIYFNSLDGSQNIKISVSIIDSNSKKLILEDIPERVRNLENEQTELSKEFNSNIFEVELKNGAHIIQAIPLVADTKIQYRVMLDDMSIITTSSSYLQDKNVPGAEQYRSLGALSNKYKEVTITEDDVAKGLKYLNLYFNNVTSTEKVKCEINIIPWYNKEITLSQTTGNSTTTTMSQDAITRAIQEVSGASPENRFADRPDSGYENFLVDVDVSIADNDNNSLDLQVIQDIKQDRGILCLPVNYSKSGNPVRLVILSYGTGLKITSSTTQPTNTAPLSDILLAEGYATMMMNGTPGDIEGTTIGSNGCPESIRSILAGYKYVTNKYNIATDGVFVSGYSQGSLCSAQIAINGSIPVLAACAYGPDLDMWKIEFSLKSAGVRERMCSKFGFVAKKANRYVASVFSNYTEDATDVPKPTFTSSNPPTEAEMAYVINNVDRWSGYNPATFGLSNENIAKLYSVWNKTDTESDEEYNLYKNVNLNFPVPIKFFVNDDDTTTPYKFVKYIQTMMINAGRIVEVRRFVSGGHGYPSNTNSIDVDTKYGGTKTTKVNTWEGILFFNSYNK